MRLVLIASVLFAAAPIRAGERSLAPSPSKSFEVVVANVDRPSEAEVVFRTPSGKQIGSVGLGGYSAEAEILWSPEGDYAALQRHFTRHTVETLVFRVTVNGIRQVKIQDYAQNIYGRLNVLHGGRGSVDKPLRWLSADRLLICATGTLDPKDRDDAGYDYEVEIRIIPDADDLVGWLEKIRPAKPSE